jgi:hypothetical protein
VGTRKSYISIGKRGRLHTVLSAAAIARDLEIQINFRAYTIKQENSQKNGVHSNEVVK